MKIKDKRGFTLVEIIAAVAILGILSIVAVISVSKIIENAKEEHYKTAEKQLKSASQSFAQQNRNKLPKAIGQKTRISLKELKDSNYIKDIKDYNDNPCSEDESFVEIYKYSKEEYSYKVTLKCENYTNERTKEEETPIFDNAVLDNNGKMENVTILGNRDLNISLASYSYEIYKWDEGTSKYIEKYNSGNVEVKNTPKQKTIKIDASKYTPGKIKVKITATNIYGNTHKVEVERTYGDKAKPTCVVIPSTEAYKDNWTKETRVVEVGCDDGADGSGCKQVTYTETVNSTKKNLVIRIYDNEDNYQDCEVPAYVDKTAPSCSSSGGNSAWTNGSRTLTGACTDGDGSGCTGNVTKTITNDMNSTSVSPGRVYDKVGNYKDCPANQTVKIDKIAPTTPTVGLYKWSNNSTRPTSTSGLSSIANDTWSEKHIYTKASGSTDTNGSGVDHYEYTTTGATTAATNAVNNYRSVEVEGTSTIKYRACDVAGNCSDWSSIKTIKIDKTAPDCNVTGGSTAWINATSATTNRTITATCSDTLSGCRTSSFSKVYSTDINTTTAGANGNNSGGYVEDNAGNRKNCSANQTVKIDKTAPSCSVTGGSASWINASSTTTKRTIKATCSDTLSGCKTSSFSKDYTTDINTTTAGANGNNSGGSVEDNAGNRKNCSADQTVRIDKTAPTTPTVNIYQWANNSTKPTSSSGLVTIANNTWSAKNIYTTASGSTDSTSGFDHYELTTTGVTDNVTNEHKNYRSVEASGTSTVKYRACDKAGNCSSYKSVTIKVDKIAPTCTNSGGSATWTNGSRTITGTCSDTLSGCQGNATNTINYQINTTTASPGTVYDNVGNYKVCPSDRTVKIDKTVPTCTSSGGSSTWTNGNRTITGTCNDTGGSGCTGNATKTYSTNINTTTASPGTVYDEAGNSATCPGNQTVRIDTDAPTCTSSGGNSNWTTGNRTITGTCNDTGGSGCQGNVTKTYSTDTNTTTASPGTVYDNAGNSKNCPGNQTVKIDKTAPSVPDMKFNLDSYTGTSYTLGTWANKNVYRQIKSSDSTSGIDHFEYKAATGNSCSGEAHGNETLKNASGGISNNTYYQISTPISWQEDNACFRAVDKAGNASAWSPAKLVKVDTVAPSAPTVSLVNGGWSEVANNTWHNFDVYVAGKANSYDPNPTSTDSGSGIKKYQISTNNSTWYDWSYDYSSSRYHITTQGTTYRYIRAVDNAGNVSSVTTKTIKVDTTAPAKPDMKYNLNSYDGTTYSSGTWTNKTVYRQIKSSDTHSGIDHFEYVGAQLSYISGTWDYVCPTEKDGNETLSNASSGISNNTYYRISYAPSTIDRACFRAVDKVGNASSWTPVQKLLIDKTAPVMKIEYNGSSYTGTINYNTARSYTTYVWCADVDSGPDKLTVTGPSMNWNNVSWLSYKGSFFSTLDSKPSGTYKAYCYDVAGNKSNEIKLVK